MANTIKFGDGQWATKEDSILAYNDENANFKPLPFVTSRASTATRVNKAGLLETVASGVPRVDYLGNSKGSYLLEPSSTNLITQSESFGNTYWTKSGATIEGDASTAGSELVNNSNWVVSNVTESLGVITFTDDGADSYALLENTLTVGLMYKISYTIDSYSNGALSINEIFNVPTSVGNHTIYSTATNQRVILDDIGETSLVISNVSVKEVSGFSAPSVDAPLGAFKLVANSINSDIFRINTGISGVNYSNSLYMKRVTGIGSVYLKNANNVHQLVELTNEWKRFDNNAISNSTTLLSGVRISDSGDEIMIFASQLEPQSYATSYIPTKGSQISRLSETASQTVSDGIINSTEGVLYFEGSALANGTNRRISITNNSTKKLFLGFEAQTNKLRFFLTDGLSTQADIFTTSNDLTNYNKIAILWANNRFEIWVNGVKEANSAGGVTTNMSGLDSIFFDWSGSSNFYGNVKDLRVFNTALTDSELQTLTTI